MTERVSFPGFNTFRPFVIDEMNRRRFNIPTPTNVPFVRMTSGKFDKTYNYKFFTLGLHGWEPSDNIFTLTYGNEDVIGYAIRNGQRVKVTSKQSVATKNMISAEGHHPIPGITRIHTEWKGPTDPIRCDVTWTCYNSTQLEFLRPHFLMAGGYVVIEWGHEFSDEIQHSRLKFEDPNIESTLAQLLTDGRGSIIDQYVTPSNGNYNFLIGQIVNQSIRLTADNGFECTTTLFGTAESIFGLGSYSPSSPAVIDDSTKQSKVAQIEKNTIVDFFTKNSFFDQIVKDDSYVPVEKKRLKIGPTFLSTKGSTITAVRETFNSIFGDSQNYITWDAFTNVVLFQLFNSVAIAGVSKEFSTILTLGGNYQNPGLIASPVIDEPVVANHPKMKSTDPTVMVLAKADIDSDLFPKDNLFVGPNGSQYSGVLNNGVWLNIEAIRDSFLSTNNFRDGFMTLLNRLNNATGNYWNLSLGWDEDRHKYSIFDKHFPYTDKTTFLFGNNSDIYEFNQDSKGELFSLEFESSYTKEVASQILIGNAGQLNPNDYSSGYTELIKHSTAVGSITSGYSQVINSSELPDLLASRINNLLPDEFTTHQTLNYDLTPLTTSQNVAAADALPRRYQNPQTATAMNNNLAEQRAANDQAALQSKQNKQAQQDFIAKFGMPLLPYVNFNIASQSIDIRNDGLSDLSHPNSFVAPIPTDIQMTLTINGIAGLSMFDYFLVQKLPAIYKKYGVFTIIGLSDDISADGWQTTLSAMYYFVWPDGKGPPNLRG